MDPAQVADFLNTPPNPADPALVADVRSFFASLGSCANRDKRIQAWRDDATPSTRSAVVEMLNHGSLARSTAMQLVTRLVAPSA